MIIKKQKENEYKVEIQRLKDENKKLLDSQFVDLIEDLKFIYSTEPYQFNRG